MLQNNNRVVGFAHPNLSLTLWKKHLNFSLQEEVKDNRTKRRPATINLLPFTVHSFLPCALSSMRFDSIVSSLSSAVQKYLYIYGSLQITFNPVIPALILL